MMAEKLEERKLLAYKFLKFQIQTKNKALTKANRKAI